MYHCTAGGRYGSQAAPRTTGVTRAMQVAATPQSAAAPRAPPPIHHNRAAPAIDVGSRPYGKSSFLGKPIGIVSNSPGPLGGVCAAMNLKQILPGYSGPILQQPEIYLNGVGDGFDDKGELTKESLEKVLKDYIAAFAAWVDKHKA
mgnify:CR=1 FL=1